MKISEYVPSRVIESPFFKINDSSVILDLKSVDSGANRKDESNRESKLSFPKNCRGENISVYLNRNSRILRKENMIRKNEPRNIVEFTRTKAFLMSIPILKQFYSLN